MPLAAPKARIDPPRAVPLAAVAAAVALIEALTLIVAAVLAKLVHIDLVLDASQATASYAGLGAVLAAIAQVTFRQWDLYESSRLLQRSLSVGRIVAATGMAFLLLLALLYLLKAGDQYSRGWMAWWFALSCALIVATRAIVHLYTRVLVAEGRLRQRVAIYGAGDLGERVGTLLAEHEPNVGIVGVYDDVPRAVTGSVRIINGGIKDLITLGQTNAIDRVIVALPVTDGARIGEIMGELSVLPIDVHLCPDVWSLPWKIRGGFSMGRLMLLEFHRRPLSERDDVVKAVMDFVLAAVALAMLAPLLLAVALAIKLDSPGPVLFRQKRHGYNHRVIRVYKFRSMNVLEEEGKVRQAEKDDARVTRVGRFIRRTSIDELPQLVNVLKGEMSLVGPRPHAVYHNEQYQVLVEQYACRHRVKPGITGWAQVNGFRGETSDPDLMRKRVEHDLDYIDNWSLWHDVKILFRTVLVLMGRNTY